MEVEEVTSLSIAPIVGTSFALHWSENGSLAILTERGIHILELAPTPMSPQPILRFNRSFIYPPDPAPGEIFTQGVGKKIWDLERDDIYPLLMQQNLTPNLNGLTPIELRIKKVCWSPKNIVFPNKCLVAVVTATGCCLILRQCNGEWYIAFDLSRQKLTEGVDKSCDNSEEVANCERIKTLEVGVHEKSRNGKNNKKCLNDNLKHGKSSGSLDVKTTVNDATSMANKLIATAVAWSSDWNPCYVLVAYRNRAVVIYGVPRLCSTDPIVTKIKGKIQMEEIVNEMCWISNGGKSSLVIISDAKGNIHGCVLEDTTDSLSVKKKEIYCDYGDKILVTSFHIISDNDETVVAATKGTFLALLIFNENKEFVCLKHLQVDGFPISGIARITNGEALLTTDNGVLYHFRAESFECVEVKVQHSSQTKERFLGMATSPSGALIAYVSSPATLYDHLVYREPSKLIVIAPKTVDPMAILMKNPSQSLGEVWDSFELLRIRATRTLKLPEVPNVESSSKYELKIHLWISIMNEVLLKKNVIKSLTVTADPFEPQLNVFISSVCDFAEKLLTKQTLNTEEATAVKNVEMYLEVFLAAEEDGKMSRRAEETLEKIKQRVKEDGTESCALCNAMIDDVPWRATRCTQGHILPRCGLTLLQIPSVNQKVCKICQQIFHPLVGDTTCPYCDVPLASDGRVVGVSCEMGKSLPRKVISITIPEMTQKEFL